MTGPLDLLMNHVVLNINAVRTMAEQQHGQCTWRFSQSQDPVRSLIRRAKSTSHGICEILSAKWVCEEFHGRSLRQWLGGAEDQAEINMPRLALLAQAAGSGGGANVQEDFTEAWMRRNFVPPRAGFQPDMGGAPERTSRFEVDDLLDDLKRKSRRDQALPLHALVSFGRAHMKPIGPQAHTTALRMEEGAIRAKYFDPNFGEFRFNSQSGFFDWFRPFFRRSHYAKLMNGYYKVRYF